MIKNILIMFFATAAIAFFVAFIIKMIFLAIGSLNNFKRKIFYKDEVFISTQEILKLQKDAGNISREGEVYAAIAMALFLYNEEKNEMEKLELTIKRSVRPYSPWSSKIYGIRQHLR